MELKETLRRIVDLQGESQRLYDSTLALNELIQFAKEDYLPENVDLSAYEAEIMAKAENEKNKEAQDRNMIIVGLLGAMVVVTIFFIFIGAFWVGIIADIVLLIVLGKVALSSDDKCKANVNKANSEVWTKKNEIEKNNKEFNESLKTAKNNLEKNQERYNREYDERQSMELEIKQLFESIDLHRDYRAPYITAKLLEYLEKGREETLMGAINRYEDEEARDRFQSRQIQLEQQRLAEAQIQSHYAKEQARYAQEQAEYAREQAYYRGEQAYYRGEQAKAAQRAANAAERAARSSERSARANERAADDIRELNSRDYYRNG